MKRRKHNEHEVQRRRQINLKFAELQRICQSKSDRRSVLQGAIDTIHIHHEKIENLKQRVRQLKSMAENSDDFFGTGDDNNVLNQTFADQQQQDVNIFGSHNFQNVYQNISAPIAILSSNGTITDCNSAFCNLIGKEKDFIISQDTVFGVFTTLEYAEFVLQIQQIIDGKLNHICINGNVLHQTGYPVPITSLISSMQPSSSLEKVEHLSWIAIRDANF
jgi:PAS domain S-box-containing protein